MHFRVKKFPVKRTEGLALQNGEQVLLETKAARARGRSGGAIWDPLLVTNRRILWHSTGFPRFYNDVNLPLSVIEELDKTRGFARAQGGPSLRLKLASGRNFSMYWRGSEEELDNFIEKLREIVADRKSTEAPLPAHRRLQAGQHRLWVWAVFMVSAVTLVYLSTVVHKLLGF